ncbi:helix-turn-helix transcriptional regulator [Desulfosporosinus lacus]|uniref:HTH cro/C1-type domain-containing protein n=1 Tax=Desulfosporosinus lacus DSM 15449 TaxID=1121420 RepID=A0A1M5Q4D9_9FIRM|nr:helix-turn-helix transcriptional regulator [Desulfosporosinus lacus]SHH09137.1 hypothetical protein SAMN02746098_00143 [Desulfosporosinus lacus DSM 15449]
MAKLMLNKDAFVKALRNLRTTKKLSDIAKDMDIDRSHLYKVLNKNQEPGRKFIEGALKVFPEISFNELFFLTNVVNKFPGNSQEEIKLNP